jgi:hypothetical protein
MRVWTAVFCVLLPILLALALASPSVDRSGRRCRLRAATQMSVFLRKPGNLWLLV